MADAGLLPYPITLNPTAQEFRPMYLYYTYPFNYPPPPPPLAAPPVATYMIPAPPPPLSPPSTLPTRSLLLSAVPADVEESIVRRELEAFGDIRAVQMESLPDGIVTVHFYDLRHATAALNQIREEHMQQQCRIREHFDGLMIVSPTSPQSLSVPTPPSARGLISGCAIWAQYIFPVTSCLADGYNQGTIVIFNLDSDVSNGQLRDIFEAFGCVRELREPPFKKDQKFIEFYDTRDAAKAVAAMNGQEINGMPMVVKFSRPIGYKYNPILPYRPQPQPQPQPPRHRQDGVVDEGGFRKNWKRENKAWRWSRYAKEKCDRKFMINQDSCPQESRTTVMIKNIPNKYSQKLLLNMLDSHCLEQPLSSYDFVYLPIDFVNKCNVGYGFVNMTSPEAAWRLYKAFHNKNWEVFNSKKICEISYARLQGLEALKQHFKNSKFPEAAEENMPVVFTPPRDGKTLTEPMLIVGRSSSITSPSPSPSPSSLSSDDNLPGLLVEDMKSDAGAPNGGAHD